MCAITERARCVIAVASDACNIVAHAASAMIWVIIVVIIRMVPAVIMPSPAIIWTVPVWAAAPAIPIERAVEWIPIDGNVGADGPIPRVVTVDVDVSVAATSVVIIVIVGIL